MSQEEVKQLPKTVNQFKKELQARFEEDANATITVAEALEIFENIKNSKGTTRGQLAGIAIEDMTDEQLKREIINANSVLYKAKKRGASEEIIAKNQARVDAAIAERDSRKAAAAPATEENATVESNEVYSDEDALNEL